MRKTANLRYVQHLLRIAQTVVSWGINYCLTFLISDSLLVPKVTALLQQFFLLKSPNCSLTVLIVFGKSTLHFSYLGFGFVRLRQGCAM